MYIDKEMRAKLTELSTVLYKRPNVWRKILEKGSRKLVKSLSGFDTNVAVVEHLTPESLLLEMQTIKAKIDEELAKVKKGTEALAEDKIPLKTEG